MGERWVKSNGVFLPPRGLLTDDALRPVVEAIAGAWMGKNKISEIKEDYPWVVPLLEAARGLTVPCKPEELTGKWTAEHLERVRQVTDKLPPRRFDTDPYRSGSPEALIDDLVELAVLYRPRTPGSTCPISSA